MDVNEARDYGVWGCSGIGCMMCKQSAPHFRQITTPAPLHSIFFVQFLCLQYFHMVGRQEEHPACKNMMYYYYSYYHYYVDDMMLQRIKANQIQKLLHEEKDVLAEQVVTFQHQVESQNLVVRKLEEKERILLSNLAAIEKELA